MQRQKQKQQPRQQHLVRSFSRLGFWQNSRSESPTKFFFFGEQAISYFGILDRVPQCYDISSKLLSEQFVISRLPKTFKGFRKEFTDQVRNLLNGFHLKEESENPHIQSSANTTTLGPKEDTNFIFRLHVNVRSPWQLCRRMNRISDSLARIFLLCSKPCCYYYVSYCHSLIYL